MSKIPKLRFKEFSEEWEEYKLGEISKFRRGSFPQPYGLPEWYDDENGMPFVQVFDVDSNMKLKPDTKNKISALAQPSSVFVEQGSIVLTIQGSIGRIALTQYDAYVDRTLLIFTDYVVPINKEFFMYLVFLLFEIEKRNAPGGTIKTITKEALTDFNLSLPNIEEQQKIASFFSAIDSKIDQLTRKKELLEQYKKGVMQKIFSQELQFKADDGSEFSEWEEKTIADCITESKIKGDTGDKAKKLTVKLWNKGVFAKNEIMNGSENTQYYIRKAGQFIYSKLDFLNCAFGIIPEYLDGYQSTIDLPCFDFINGINPLFFLLRVSREDFYLRFGEQADGSRKARRINQNIFLEMPILLPSIEEQTKIANFLSVLDTKIDFLTKQLDEAKNFKKGLFQQMFV